MDFVRSHFGKMQLWPVEPFFYHKKVPLCHLCLGDSSDQKNSNLNAEIFSEQNTLLVPIKSDTFELLKMRIGSNNWDVEIYGEKLENIFWIDNSRKWFFSHYDPMTKNEAKRKLRNSLLGTNIKGIKRLRKYFSNFCCMFLNPNNFFQFEL